MVDRWAADNWRAAVAEIPQVTDRQRAATHTRTQTHGRTDGHRIIRIDPQVANRLSASDDCYSIHSAAALAIGRREGEDQLVVGGGYGEAAAVIVAAERHCGAAANLLPGTSERHAVGVKRCAAQRDASPGNDGLVGACTHGRQAAHNWRSLRDRKTVKGYIY